MIQHPAEISPLLKEKNIENIFFKKYLRNYSSATVDANVHELNKSISTQIDCINCANCCKQLEPGLEQAEMEVLAAQQNMLPEDFKSRHVQFDGDTLFLKTKPCMFLHECKCTAYTIRPKACADYPHLNQKDMKYKRSLWENYGICPIVFNVVESLKERLGFHYGK